MPTLNEMGPSKLLGDQQERIREAADHLIFSRDLGAGCPNASGDGDIERLCRALVDSARWEQAVATRLANDASQGGPTAAP